MSKLHTHSPVFKARVVMEAISGRKTTQEIAADHAIRPIQVSQRKRQLLDGASELFTRGKKSTDVGESQVKEAELFQQIGKLQMELEWLKKISAALMPVNCENCSITTIQSSASAGNARCWSAQIHALLPTDTGAGLDEAVAKGQIRGCLSTCLQRWVGG